MTITALIHFRLHRMGIVYKEQVTHERRLPGSSTLHWRLQHTGFGGSLTAKSACAISGLVLRSSSVTLLSLQYLSLASSFSMHKSLCS